MPDSELPAEVWTEAQEILDDEIGTIWRDYINDSLSGSADIQYIEAQLTEFVGSEELLQKWRDNELDYEETELLSQNILIYISTHQTSEAAIWFLPSSTITNAQWARAAELAELEIGDLW